MKKKKIVKKLADAIVECEDMGRDGGFDYLMDTITTIMDSIIEEKNVLPKTRK